jgi:hypothetical protein
LLAAVAALIGVVVVVPTEGASAVGPPERLAPVPAAALPVVPDGAVYVPLTPCRVADTRATASMQPGTTRGIQVGGAGAGFAAQGGRAGGCGVPADAVAAELSISAVTPSGDGYLRAWPSGVAPPNATFVNYSSRQGTTNTGAIPLGTGTKDLTLGNNGARAHYVVDVQGYYAAPDAAPDGSVYVPITPCRAVDTRASSSMAPNTTRTFQLGGAGSLAGQGGRAGGCGVPADATAVEASVSAVTPTGTGYFRAWPTGAGPAAATFLNYSPAQGTTNTGALAIAGGATPGVTVRNFAGRSHYVIDVQGYFADPDTVQGSLYVPVTPCRVVDTRSQGLFAPMFLGPGSNALWQVAGDGPTVGQQGGRPGGCGVPDGATAVEAAVSAVTPFQSGYVRAHPSGITPPNATLLNYANGRATTNAGAVPLAATGVQDLVVSNYGGAANIVVDVLGYFSDGTVAPTELSGVTQLDSGGSATCALLVDTTVTCWGYGPMFSDFDVPAVSPLAVPGLSGVAQISVGDLHACALLGDGTVRCWGANGLGQLGDGSRRDRSAPVPVAGLSDVVQLSAGGLHSCATLADGSARCWGDNSAGQLGGAVPVQGSTTPVGVAGLDEVEQIVASRGELFIQGESSTCARRADGSVRCWGANSFGQLGDGTLNDSTVPAAVIGLDDATSLAVGLGHACASTEEGTAVCWGSDDSGQLGDGTAGGVSTVPVPVQDLAGAFAVAAASLGFFFAGDESASHSCALVAGAVRCWGSNELGALGDGTLTSSSTSVAVAGLSEVSQLSAGGGHSCVLRADGSVRCWGFNGFGALGVGSIAPSVVDDVRTTPAAVVL